MPQRIPLWILFGTILILGAALRITGQGWDEYTGLHPDERYMTYVVGDMVHGWRAATDSADGTTAWFRYLDSRSSPLNPRNHHSSYVYGDVPVVLVAVLCRLAGVDDMSSILRWGRLAAVVFDLLTLWFILLAVRLAGGGLLALAMAAAGYGFMPLAVQHSHFFTVDVFATTAGTLALLYLIRAHRHPELAAPAWAGVATGAALACKLSMMPLVPAGMLVLLAARPGTLPRAALRVTAFGLGILIAFRVFNPSAFDGLFTPARSWLDSLAALRASQAVSLDGPPPAWQWVDIIPGLHVGRNLAMWGVGPAFSILVLVAVAGLLAGRRWRHCLVLIVTVVCFLALLAFRPVQPQRYLLPMLPAFVILTALVLEHAVRRARTRWIWSGLIGLALAAHLGYGLAVNQLHRAEHTRLAASRWIWQHWPVGSAIAVETDWDDALPWYVRLPGEADTRGGFGGGAFRGLNLRLTDPYSPAKLEHVVRVLIEADYVVISSGRQMGVMPRFPERFPLVARYYPALFTGELGFELVATFHQPLRVWGLEVDDSAAEETWTVYDHPRVWLFARVESVDPEILRSRLDPGS